MKFNSVLEIINELRSGRMVILVDDESRENEGDLVMAAHFVTPETVNFMIKEARGLVCVSLTSQQVKRLKLSPMVDQSRNYSPNKTHFTVSVESARGVSTGISVHDRAHTIQTVANPHASAEDVISPGHIFPIQAQDGGVLKRAGHTEASVDFCRLAGLNPAAVICEITNEDGSMARAKDLFGFAKKHDLKIGTIEDLIKYRISNESLVKEKVQTSFATGLGKDWRIFVFYDEVNNREHMALVKGKTNLKKPILVRVHSSCLSGDLFQDEFLKSGHSLQKSLDIINKEGQGVVVYLRMEHQISKQIEFHKTQWKERKPFEFDNKDYGIGAQILRALGISQIRLITNSPSRRIGLKGYGLNIVETVNVSDKPVALKVQK